MSKQNLTACISLQDYLKHAGSWLFAFKYQLQVVLSIRKSDYTTNVNTINETS